MRRGYFTRIILLTVCLAISIIFIPFFKIDYSQSTSIDDLVYHFTANNVNWYYFSVTAIYAVFSLISLTKIGKGKILGRIFSLLYQASFIANTIILVLYFNYPSGEIATIPFLGSGHLILALVLSPAEFILYTTLNILTTLSLKDSTQTQSIAQVQQNASAVFSNEVENNNINFGSVSKIDPSEFKSKIHQFQTALSKSYEEALDEVEKTGSLQGIDIGKLDEIDNSKQKIEIFQKDIENNVVNPYELNQPSTKLQEFIKPVVEQEFTKAIPQSHVEQVQEISEENFLEQVKPKQPEHFIPSRLKKDPLESATFKKDYDEISGSKLSETEGKYD